MSYHIEGGKASFEELPSRILMREDGYLSAYRLDGKPVADYWYVPESECLNLRTENAKLRELVSDEQPFWHRMADEEPSDEKGKYLLLGKCGAMYLANGFHTWEHSGRKSFYIPNNRSGYVDFDKVYAWAVVPEMEEDK